MGWRGGFRRVAVDSSTFVIETPKSGSECFNGKTQSVSIKIIGEQLIGHRYISIETAFPL